MIIKHKIPAEYGAVAVSPNAKGYYSGANLLNFMYAFFVSRLAIKQPTNAEIFVSGELYALDMYCFLHAHQNENCSRFVQQSTKEARKHGKAISADWISKSTLKICQAADGALADNNLKSTDGNQRVSVNIPSKTGGREEVFKKHKPGGVVQNPYLNVEIFTAYSLIKNKEAFFVSTMAKIIVYANYGQELLRNSHDKTSPLTGTSFPAETSNSFGTHLSLNDILNTEDFNIEFIALSLNISKDDFEQAIEKEAADLETCKEKMKDIAIAVNTKILAAATPFFLRKTISILEKHPLEKSYSDQDKKANLLKIFSGCRAYAVADAAYFRLFKGRHIFYACPASIDEIQGLLDDVVDILFNERLSFPVQLIEANILPRPLANIHSLQPYDQQLLSTAYDDYKKGKITTAVMILLAKVVAENAPKAENDHTKNKLTVMLAGETKSSSSSSAASSFTSSSSELSSSPPNPLSSATI